MMPEPPPTEPVYIHKACLHCRHAVTTQKEILVNLVVLVPAHLKDTVTPEQMVDALKDGLPKEWWWGNNMADWGLSDIEPMFK